MRSFVVVLVWTLAALSGGQPAAAQSANGATQLLTKSPTRGFEWFFANVRPEGSCATGNHVVATLYATGHRTANGEVFNPDGHTAAHRTLPFGSRVVVVNPRTGKSIIVVINDRGPFVKGVTLDLARGAARAIGMHSTQWVCMADARQ